MALLRTALAARRTTLLATSRTLSTSARTFDEHNRTSAPRPIEDSTSALDYKSQQTRRRPPPLPAADVFRKRSAEEAVTNILYNTPPPSTQPFKKCVLPGLWVFSRFRTTSTRTRLTCVSICSDTLSIVSSKMNPVFCLAYLVFLQHEASISTLSSSAVPKSATSVVCASF